MKIIKKKINGYDLFVYNTKKYSTIHLQFLFEMPYTRDNIFMCDLLEEYMLYTNGKYKTKEEIGDRKMELYSLDAGISNFYRGEAQFTKVNFAFYDPELVNDDYMKEAFEFAGDLMFKPNFKDGKLDREILDRVKTNLINDMGEDLLNPRGKSSRSFIKTLFPDTYKTRDMIESKEEYEGILNSYSDKDLIEIYERLVHGSLVGVLLMGNIKDEYYDYIEEIFKFKNTKEFDRKFKDKLKISKKTDFFTTYEDTKTKDSMLREVYTCPARNLKERMTYNVISRMLSSSGMIIHKILRDQMNIVYSAGSSYNMRQDYMILGANLDKKNKDKARSGFALALEELKNRETIGQLLEKIKAENEEFLYCYQENKFNLFGELYDRAYKLDIPDKTCTKVMNAITVDDVARALEKMELVKVHFYMGVKE